MKHTLKKGFSLVEMIIYIAILSVFTVVIVNTLVSFGATYREVRINRTVDNSALVVMERMTRDIRGATNVVVGQSVFGSNPGALTLFVTNALTSTTTRFYLDNGRLLVDVNSVYSGPLSSSQTSITNLTFNRLVSSSSEAVKIDMTMQYQFGSTTKTKNYYTTVILKGL